ncbi:MAG: helix-turn-helix domain-containing protein, partial [Sphingomicrobium sp.]
MQGLLPSHHAPQHTKFPTVPPGQRSRLSNAHRTALTAVIESGPIPAIHGVVRWRIVDLCQWVWDEFRISISKQTMSRELRAFGYRKLSARPRTGWLRSWPESPAAIRTSPCGRSALSSSA